MLQVVSLGHIVQDPACYTVLTGKPVVFPDHYTIRRGVFVSPTTPAKPTLLHKNTTNEVAAAAAAMEQPYFTAAVYVASSATGPTTLHFVLTRSDNPTEKVYKGERVPTTVWRAALEAAAVDFPERKGQLVAPYDAKGRLQVNGARLFGLHLKEIQEALTALPGGAAAFESAAAAVREVSPPPSPPAPAAGKTTASTVSPTRATAPAAKSVSRKRTRRGASAEHGAAAVANNGHHQRSGSITVTSAPDERGHSNSQPPSVVALTPVKPKRTRKAKVGAATDAAGVREHSTAATGAAAVAVVEGAESSVAPPAKRRRASPKKTTATAATGSSSSGGAAPASTVVAPIAVSAAMVVCPDCGLAGTPFCAATGRPHETAPCPTCGLRTAYCPVSGLPHTGAVQRENRQRGEVHLPGASRKPRSRKAGAKAGLQQQQQQPGQQDVAEIIVVNTQDGSGSSTVIAADDATVKKPRRRRGRPTAAVEGIDGVVGAATKTSIGPSAEVGGNNSTAPVPAKRGRRSKKVEAAASTSPEGVGAAPASAVGDNAAVATGAPSALPEGEISLFDLAKESVYIYPPLRPPLSHREHHKAAQLLQEAWKAQYGDGPVLPPAVAAVPLAFVPAKRTAAGAGASASAAAAAAGSKGRRRGRGAAVVKEEEDDDGNNNNNDDDAHANNALSPEEAEADGEGAAAEVADLADHASEEASHDDAHTRSVPRSAATGSLSALPSMVHPLEVTQLATSVAGKRLTKFLLQYTSERSQLDLLRSHTAAITAAAAGGSGERRKASKKKDAAHDDGAEGGEEAVQAAHTSENNNEEEITETIKAADAASEEVSGGVTPLAKERNDAVANAGDVVMEGGVAKIEKEEEMAPA